MKRPYEANVWILIERAPDLPGQWVAHCLDFDVVTQGSSLQHAYNMALEAITMVVEEDIAAGRDPMERRAPAEAWARLWTSVRRAQKLPPGVPFPTEEKFVSEFIVQLVLHVLCDAPQRREDQLHVPLAMVSSEGLTACV